MSLVVTSSSIVTSSYIGHQSVSKSRSCEDTSKNSYFPLIRIKSAFCSSERIHTMLRRRRNGFMTSTVIKCSKPNVESIPDEDMVLIDLGDQENEDGEDAESPWEGAVMYKRNASITHVEYCTTLERLGLGNLSTEVAKSRASLMGLRVTKAVKDYPDGTPVQISIDITRRKQKLRLDGIIKTVITLTCNSCGDPAAESIFSNFSLLLSDEPIEEPDIIDMGVMYGDKVKTYTEFGDQGEENDDDSIDFEDQLYFRPECKEIDISKHIRDSIHLEITISATCNPNCKGLCFNCGRNLNTSKCICGKEETKKPAFGPLANLKKQMQRT